MDFSICYRNRYAPDRLHEVPLVWDVLVSAYNESARVHRAFELLEAEEKLWIVESEYGYDAEELPEGAPVLELLGGSEAVFASQIVERLRVTPEKRVCVDATGFMRPTLMALIQRLLLDGLDRLWVVYSDPGQYVQDERTDFTRGGVRTVRQVDGFQGLHDPASTDRDVLLLGTGYDLDAMNAVILEKRHARRADLFGLPSLQPSMYQENVLSVALLGAESGHSLSGTPLYSGANDPFETAQVLNEWAVPRLRSGEITNLYLAPTGTKAQALGFALFYLSCCRELPVSVLAAIPNKYRRETSEGHARTWVFEIDSEALGLEAMSDVDRAANTTVRAAD